MEKKRYGVWGLGIVGKSVIRYLSTQGHELSVMDKRAPSQEDKLFLEAHNALFIPQEEQQLFFARNDRIVISPGIPRPATIPHAALIEEIDLFCDAWKKPVIAVTGSVGKTSTVSLLSQLMSQYDYRVALGGNVGTGMLDLLDTQQSSDYAVLELSSFQLEHSKRCTPDLALWLNFYSNHLDRHHTIEEYFLAKYALIKHQKASQKALVSFSLQERLRALTARPLHFFSCKSFTDKDLSSLLPLDVFYGKRNAEIIKIENNKEEILMPVTAIPHLSFEENWLALIASLDILLKKEEAAFTQLSFSASDITVPEHRLEKVATINDITFYNDSKSSIFEATQAAVESLQPKRIHLLLGGISKGVARTSLLPALKDKVASIHCFGAEAEELYQAAKKANIPAECYSSLEEACTTSFKKASPHDTILLSPAGASFDLFKDYKERGNAFKEIVQTKLGSSQQ